MKNPSGRTRGLKRGGSPGRPKGVPNKVTVEVKAAASAFVDDPTYRRKLAADLRARKVNPAIESMLWHYAKGKPKETVGIEGSIAVGVTPEQIKRMSDEDLAAVHAAGLIIAGVIEKAGKA